MHKHPDKDAKGCVFKLYPKLLHCQGAFCPRLAEVVKTYAGRPRIKPSSSTYHLLMKEGKGASIELISEKNEDGARTVFVFDESVAAKVFLIIENLVEELDPGWEVIQYAPQTTAELLEACADEDVGYVVLNPPSALTRGDEESQPIPIRQFIGNLLGE